MDSALQVRGIDHIVLNVKDAERSIAFYCDLLGLQPVRVEQWRNREVGFPSVRVNEGTIIDLSEFPRTGENLKHFCLVINPTDLQAIASSGVFDIEKGPGFGFGAQGVGHSVYVRDPDANIVELRYYD